MRPLRVLIADDEALARARLERLLGAMAGVQLVGQHDRAEGVLARVAEGGVDVLLLDIHMPGLSGLDALELLPPGGPRVVYVTAHAEHAVRAFEQGVADYVLKPVDAGRLHKALDRARAHLPRLDRLPIETRKGVVLLSPDEISHVVLAGELAELFTDRGAFSTDKRLAELEERLPAERFLRVHRQALVNLDRVERLEPTDTGGYVAHLRGGAQVPVSRAAARELRRMLDL